ncbi:MAG: electron transfer flavoprotein subunit alpha/FixB family protein [Syntrophales bacterium]|nr:electron transfer flavoprotein subunit alpha/FixB family protein [Syntrophales bacterium]
MRVVVILPETDTAGGISPVMGHTIRFATALARVTNAPAPMLIVSRGAPCVATQGDGAALTSDGAPWDPETETASWAAFLREAGTSYICLPHTSRAWGMAPALAFRLGGAMITAAESCREEGGRLIFTRSLYNGRLRADVTATTTPVVLTVQAAVVRHEVGDAENAPPALPNTVTLPPAAGEESNPQPAGKAARIRFMGVLAGSEEDCGLRDATVICAVGRGIGKEDDLGLIHTLAGLFRKSAVGCSRPICDAGWLPANRQIGLTGQTVSPAVYIACGISGASPHVAGMRDARTIIAINRDPQAAIFQVAHYGIVADLLRFLPTVLALSDRKGAVS